MVSRAPPFHEMGATILLIGQEVFSGGRPVVALQSSRLL